MQAFLRHRKRALKKGCVLKVWNPAKYNFDKNKEKYFKVFGRQPFQQKVKTKRVILTMVFSKQSQNIPLDGSIIKEKACKA